MKEGINSVGSIRIAKPVILVSPEGYLNLYSALKNKLQFVIVKNDINKKLNK